MKRLSEHLKEPSMPSKRDPSRQGRAGADRATERGELLKYFMERLNASRVRDGYPPLTLARMGRTLVGIPTEDLYYLKSVCDDAKDFSKKFWWEVNPKKHEK